jgi:hypothetical protein
MSRYQNSGSQSAAEACRPRRGGRRGVPGLSAALDGGRDELRGLRVDDDVPAEQNAAGDLPGMWRRVVRADGGLGHTRDCRTNGAHGIDRHTRFATRFSTPSGL